MAEAPQRSIYGILPRTSISLDPVEPELRSYAPTLRDRVAGLLMDLGGDKQPSQSRRNLVGGLLGSLGAGSMGAPGLLDFTPAGALFGLDEAVRSGDLQGSALAAMPGGPAVRGVKKLPMDAASRMARTTEMRFRTNMPLEIGVAPQGEKIAGAAVIVDGRVFTGRTHLDATTEAARQLGIPFDKAVEKLAGVSGVAGGSADVFMTTSGRLVNRREADVIASRMDQGSGSGRFGALRGLAAEDINEMAPMASIATGATSPSSAAHRRATSSTSKSRSPEILAAADHPELTGGHGIWGRQTQSQHRSASTATGSEAAAAPLENSRPTPTTRAWYRSDRTAKMDATGAREHEIQRALLDAWDQGFDAVEIKNYIRPGGDSPETIMFVRNQNQLRDMEKARFDPAKRDSANIMAGLAGVLPAAGWSAPRWVGRSRDDR